MVTKFQHLWVALALMASTSAWAESQRALVLEVAPLRGVMGHPALRVEAVPASTAAFALGIESADAASERADFKDRRRAMMAEGLWYPLGFKSGGPFIGGGLAYEDATIGRQRQRDSVTWARTSANDSHDLWVNHDTYLSVEQVVGYRLIQAGLVTASLRLTRDETVQQRSRVERDEVRSGNPDLSSAGRATVVASISLFAGLVLR